MGTIKQNRANNIVTGGKIDATDGLNNNVPAANIANASLTNVTAYPPSAGAGVSQLASDPPSPTEGQMWYNTTTNTLKQYALGAGAWSTGGSLNTGRIFLGGAGNSQDAALAFGGEIVAATGVTESYDGTSWTEVNDLNTARGYGGGAGTQTSALYFGGLEPSPEQTTINESWNGTSWTEVGDLNTGRRLLGSAGADNTSALAFAGLATPGNTAVTESWNGTSWTEVNDLNTARRQLSAGTGIVTSALAISGRDAVNPVLANTESWNGTSWTEINDLNTSRIDSASTGDNTSALVFGGQPNSTLTEDWNGSSWTEVADLSTGRSILASAGAGTNSSELAFGGGTPITTATEEWNVGLSVQTITAS
jgi:hypothetical protein